MKHLIILSFLLTSLTSNAQDRKLQVEANHSTLAFNIPIAGFTIVTGKFNDYQIIMDWDDASQVPTKLSSTINVKSINTGIKDRDDHLLTADFFNADTFPEITFVSDSIKKTDYSHFVAFGKLNMHGTTKNIKLPFQIVKVDGNTIGLKCRTTLNRLDYKVASDFKHTSIPGFLSNTINIEIDFWTKRRKE